MQASGIIHIFIQTWNFGVYVDGIVGRVEDSIILVSGLPVFNLNILMYGRVPVGITIGTCARRYI